LYGLYEYLFRKDVYHVLILGLDKAGKTNILERLKTLYTSLVGLDPGKILPTVGLNVGRLEANGQAMVFWDLGGQTGLRSIWDKYYDESHAVVYVVDSASKDRWGESKGALEKVLGARELYGAPVLVLANKQDLEDSAPPQELKEHFGLGKLDSRPIAIMPVCAYTGQGLRDAVDWLCSNIRPSARAQRLRVRHG